LQGLNVSACLQRTTPRTPLTPNAARRHLIALTDPKVLARNEQEYQRKLTADKRWSMAAKALVLVTVCSIYWPFIVSVGSSVFFPIEQVSAILRQPLHALSKYNTMHLEVQIGWGKA